MEEATRERKRLVIEGEMFYSSRYMI